MQMQLRRLTLAATFFVAAAIMGACADGAVIPSEPKANADAAASHGGDLQPGDVSKSMDPCPGGVCDGGGGGGAPVTTYLTGFADYGVTGDYYAIEFNFKDRFGNQVGTTKEQRWHGNSFSNGEVSSVNVGQAINCGGKVQIEVRRALWWGGWEAAGSRFILSTEGNQFRDYYDPTRSGWGVIKLGYSGCI
jgi:hypothetical protein